MTNVVRLFPEQPSADPCECFVCRLRDLDERLRFMASGALFVDCEDVAELSAELHAITHRADAYVRRMESRETRP